MANKGVGFYPILYLYCVELIEMMEYPLARILNIRDTVAFISQEKDHLLEEFIAAATNQSLSIAAIQYKEIFEAEHGHFLQSSVFIKR